MHTDFINIPCISLIRISRDKNKEQQQQKKFCYSAFAEILFGVP